MFILEWFHEIMLDQVNPALCRMFCPPSLWPGWDWAQMNAIYSNRTSPWHSSWVFSAYNGVPDDDDYDDYDDF